MQETASASKAIRAVKSNEKQLRQQGLAPTQARKMALSKVAGKSASKGKKGQKEKKESSAFEGSGLPGNRTTSTKVYAGGRRSVAAAPSASGKKKDNSAKRGGKGRNAFKSKARHKRR